MFSSTDSRLKYYPQKAAAVGCRFLGKEYGLVYLPLKVFMALFIPDRPKASIAATAFSRRSFILLFSSSFHSPKT